MAKIWKKKKEDMHESDQSIDSDDQDMDSQTEGSQEQVKAKPLSESKQKPEDNMLIKEHNKFSKFSKFKKSQGE